MKAILKEKNIEIWPENTAESLAIQYLFKDSEPEKIWQKVVVTHDIYKEPLKPKNPEDLE